MSGRFSTLNSSDRQGGGPCILLWEAFITAEDKPDEGPEHVRDALLAVRTFLDAYKKGSLEVGEEETHSLIGAALLRSGWIEDPEILEEPCPFVRPTPSE